jgi:hypothetical protein
VQPTNDDSRCDADVVRELDDIGVRRGSRELPPRSVSVVSMSAETSRTNWSLFFDMLMHTLCIRQGNHRDYEIARTNKSLQAWTSVHRY